MATSASLVKPRPPFIALENPSFRLYMLGQVISVAGNWMQTVAQGWLVYQLTGSALWLGVVAFASGLPMLLISPWAGVLADRYSRRHVMMIGLIAEMMLIAGMAFLTFLDIIEAGHIAFLAIGVGSALAFSEPARQAFVKELVGQEVLYSGIAINAMLRNTASIVGPAIAGVLLVSFGAAWCFMLNSASFLAAIITLYLVKIHYPSVSNQSKPPWQALREGLVYIATHPILAPILILATAMGVFGINAVIVLMPAYTAIALESPTAAFTMMSTALGFGSLMGSSLSVTISNRLGRGKLVLVLAMVTPLIILALSQTRSIPFAVGLTGVLGFGITMFFVTCNVMIQTEVPDEYRGRVVSIWALQRFGLSPIVALFIGLFAQITSVVTTLASLALLVLIISFWISQRSQSIRQIR